MPDITTETSLRGWGWGAEALPQTLGEETQPGSSVRNLLFRRSSLSSRRQGGCFTRGCSLLLEGSVGSQCELRTQDHTPKCRKAAPPRPCRAAGRHRTRRPGPPGPRRQQTAAPHALPAGHTQARPRLRRAASTDVGWCPDGGRQGREAGSSPSADGPLQSPRALRLRGPPGPAPGPPARDPDSLWELPVLPASAAARTRRGGTTLPDSEWEREQGRGREKTG